MAPSVGVNFFCLGEILPVMASKIRPADGCSYCHNAVKKSCETIVRLPSKHFALSLSACVLVADGRLATYCPDIADFTVSKTI